MTGFPPEKYYEACITYHLVNNFKQIFNKRLYPFSISQIEENGKGFDFGYVFSRESFYIQYKRPFSFETVDSLYSWQIERKQLNVINSQPYALNTYYALPAFVDMNQWFEGLDNTYFVDAPKLGNYLNQHRENAKTSIIHSNLNMLKTWSEFSRKFATIPRNAVAHTEQQGVNFQEIITYTKALEQEARERVWVYLLEMRQ